VHAIHSVSRHIRPDVRELGRLRSDLVERAQHGDRDAFDALATSVYHRLYAIGFRILRDGYAAEDAVQEAMIRAWRDLRSLRDPDRFEAWMHRLLVRACQDMVRRTHHDARVLPIDFERSDPADDFALVAHRDEIERAFLALSIDHRAVLVLTHYVGLPAPEVGRTLRIPTGTVYSRLHYATKAMRLALGTGAPDDRQPLVETGR
jgi:RNA polymerase sigma-70 factor (ECF subfamily)